MGKKQIVIIRDTRRDSNNNSISHVVYDDIVDRLLAMKRQEESDVYLCRNIYKEEKTTTTNNNNNHNNYHHHSVENDDDVIDEACRAEMCEWFYKVIDKCRLSRETVMIAMSYVDRFVCANEGRNNNNHIVENRRIEYLLTCMTCLYVAIKINESTSIHITSMVQMGRRLFTESDFTTMEFNILTALKWRLNGPTPLSFLRCYVELLRLRLNNNNDDDDDDRVAEAVSNDILSRAKYQIEIAVLESTFIDYRPSEIALAAMKNAFFEVVDGNSHNTTIPSEIRRQLISDISPLLYTKLESNNNHDNRRIVHIQSK